MDKIKYVKLEQPDGSYSDNIPLAVDADHVDVNGNTLTKVLGNKADNIDIDNLQTEINSLASGSPLVASSTSEMTDTTRVYVNTTDGYWYTYDGSSWVVRGKYQAAEDSETVELLKTQLVDLSEVVKSDNLFNKNFSQSSNTSDDAIILGSVNPNVKLNSAGGFSEQSSLFLSYFIKVKPNTKYTINGSGYIGVRTFKKDKNTRVNNLIDSYSGYLTFVTTSEVEYIRFNGFDASKNNIIVNKGDKIPYTPYFDSHYLIKESALPHSIPLKVSDLPNDANYVSSTNDNNINLLNKNVGLIANKQFSADGGIQDVSGWSISDLIPIEAGKTYSINVGVPQFDDSSWGYYRLYGEDKKTIIDSMQRYDKLPTPFIISIPEQSLARYIQINTFSGLFDKMMFAKSNKQLPYVPYGYEEKGLLLRKDNIPINLSNWYGKNFCAYGDSNTQNNMWQKYVCLELGLLYTGLGKGGTTSIQRCTDEELSEIPNDSKVITIMFGTNDISQNVPLGTLPSEPITTDTIFDTTTYIGALCRMIQYISINIPLCEIILIAPLFRTNTSWSDTTQSEYANFLNYVNACEQISKRFGCHFINSYQELGANIYNYKNFFIEETWGVHLNDLGAKRFAKTVISKFKDIEPIE